jgi:hypothetical protein
MKQALRFGFGWFAAAAVLVLVVPNETTLAWGRTVKKTKPNVVTNSYWSVSAVDTSSNTIELQKSNGSSNLTLKVSSATTITLEGKPAKFADLQKGLKVNFDTVGDLCSRLEAVAVSSDKKTTKTK